MGRDTVDCVSTVPKTAPRLQSSAMTQPLADVRALLRVDPKTGVLRARRYVLTVANGPDQGQTRALDAALLVGGDPEAGLRLSDPTVSQRHLELQPRADGVRVKDLRSKNGTFIAGARIDEAIVEGETSITVGTTRLFISVDDDAVEVGPAEARFGDAIGKSPVMQKLFALLARVAPTDSTVVLLGETGTGKDVLARAIHAHSARRARPFVVLDCASVAPSLVESELFGHLKGSFTGAVATREGAFVEADGGTLFLDEIGELPLELQPKLLRVLESGTVKRVGDDRSRSVNVRIVAATNRDLQAEVAAGRFRSDLYFRLAVVAVRVPALRERPEDLPLLVSHFLQRAKRPEVTLSPALLGRMDAFGWPGNVRELRNFVERALAGDLQLEQTDGAPSSARPSVTPASLVELPFKEAREKMLEIFVREYIEAMLQRCHGNVSEAARTAGIDRTYVHRLVARHGLKGD
jgi:two-component system response regulator GlrR